MATMYSLFLGILSLALCLLVGTGHRDLTAAAPREARALRQNGLDLAGLPLRQQIMHIAAGELGVRELSGNSDGERVEAYLRYTQLGKGHAWCAAFVSWCYGQAGQAQPRNPWSPALFPKARRYTLARDNDATAQSVPALADVFGIYNASAKRINHVGLVNGLSHSYILSIEGNVDNRVQAKRRLKASIAVFANWIDER